MDGIRGFAAFLRRPKKKAKATNLGVVFGNEKWGGATWIFRRLLFCDEWRAYFSLLVSRQASKQTQMLHVWNIFIYQDLA